MAQVQSPAWDFPRVVGMAPPPTKTQKQAVYVFYLFIFLFRTAPVAYGSFKARGQIRAATAGVYLSHSNARSELSLQPAPQLMATPEP